MNISRRKFLTGSAISTAALLLDTSPAFAAISLVNSTTIPGTLLGTANSAAISTVGATLLVASVGSLNNALGGAPQIFYDNMNNLWSQVPNTNAGDNITVIWFCANPVTSASHVFYCTSGVNGQQDSYFSAVVSAFSGVSTLAPWDKNQTSANEANSPGSTIAPLAAVTPTQANSLVITGAGINAATLSTPSGYTSLGSVAQSPGVALGTNMAYQVQTTATSTQPSWGCSGAERASCAIAIFLPSPWEGTVAVNYSVGTGGDIPVLVPWTTVSTTLTWSGGTATAITDATLNMAVGTVFAGFISYNLDFNNAPNAWCGEFTFTVTANSGGSTTVTYPIASNPGTAPASRPIYLIDYALYTALGAAYATPDLTIYSTGSTCPSTAADSAHIAINSGEPATIVGHPIQCIHSGTTAVCMITGLSGTIAAVSAIAGYSANFGFTPASGDSYSIFPISPTFNIGLNGTSRVHSFNPCNHNRGVIKLGPWTANANNSLLVQGNYPFSKTVPLGSPADNSSAIVIELTGSGPDHTGVFGLGGGYITFKNLQIYNADAGGGADGAFMIVAGFGDAWSIQNCVIRGDNSYAADAHYPWIMNSIYSNYAGPCYASNVVFVSTGLDIAEGTGGPPMPWVRACTFICTQNLYPTLSAPVSSGTTLTVSSVTGLRDNSGSFGVGSYASISNNGSITSGANIATISGTVAPYTVILQQGSVAGSIAAGTTIQFTGMKDIVPATLGNSTNGIFNALNCGFFGLSFPQPSTFSTFTSCAGDSNPSGQSGLSVVSYVSSINAGYALGVSSTLVDARLPIGSPLINAGTNYPGTGTDIFGQTRPNPPSIGAAEFINSGVVPGGRIFGRGGHG